MSEESVFGSGELTPDLLRRVSFAEQDGRVDAEEVRTFLGNVASALEVLQSSDAQLALRAEFARNAEIAQQVLDAGQAAARQLRDQAAAEAHRIIDETRDATVGLREQVGRELDSSRSQVEELRGQFIQDLRDLYDRIGASLYRFERAADGDLGAPITAPQEQAAPAPSEAHEPTHVPSGFLIEAELPEEAAAGSTDVPADPLAPPGVALPEGAKPPAWQQLPAEAWEPVVEDEPLAPGEPLVDLSAGFGAATELGGSWLEAPTDDPPVPEPAPDAAPEVSLGAAPDPFGETSTGGSWLDTMVEEAAPQEPGAADTNARDDALAEALIQGMQPGAAADVAAPAPSPSPGADRTAGAALEPAGAEPAAAPPVEAVQAPSAPLAAAQVAGEATDASPDAVAVRQLILDSLANGQTRETLEAHLRERLGLLEPGALIDAALNAVPPTE